MRVVVQVEPGFEWRDGLHGPVQRWHVWVEDLDTDQVYHTELWSLNKRMIREGDITLSNGEISLQNHALKGPSATAQINSRTSLSAATTETTIAIDAGSNGATDYVMTVNGPVSAPTMSIRGR